MSAEATSAEHRIVLPFPLRVLCAIWFASLSIWNRRPLNFSTDQRPLESTSRSNAPAVAVLSVAPARNLVDSSDNFAVDLSKNLSGENVCEFRSAFRPWIASGPVQLAYSQRLDFAVTVTFSIENAISWKWLLAPSPSAPSPVAYPDLRCRQKLLRIQLG